MRMLKSRGAIFMPGCCTFGSITFIIFMEYIYICMYIIYRIFTNKTGYKSYLFGDNYFHGSVYIYICESTGYLYN